MEAYEKRGYLLENFRLFHLHTAHAPGVDFHYHDFCKLLLFIRGSGSYVVDGHRYRLQPGDAVIINSHCVHKPELEENVPYERIIIYISPEFLIRESTGECNLLQCFSGENGHVLRLHETRRKKLFSMAEQLEQELNHPGFGRDIASNAALMQLLVRLGREQLRTDSHMPQPVTAEDSRVLEWMRYIDANLEEDLNIDVLAEHFYISKFHMMRLFRKETGSTVCGYLTQRRLLHARELMAAGVRATRACYRSGFRSYSSFTRAYSKYFGATPTGRQDAAHRREEGYE